MIFLYTQSFCTVDVREHREQIGHGIHQCLHGMLRNRCRHWWYWIIHYTQHCVNWPVYWGWPSDYTSRRWLSLFHCVFEEPGVREKMMYTILMICQKFFHLSPTQEVPTQLLMWFSCCCNFLWYRFTLTSSMRFVDSGFISIHFCQNLSPNMGECLICPHYKIIQMALYMWIYLYFVKHYFITS